MRVQDPAAGERVDCEVELESGRAKVAEMTDCMLVESEAAVTEARRRASETEERAMELSEQIDGLTTTAHLCHETSAGGEASGDGVTVGRSTTG